MSDHAYKPNNTINTIVNSPVPGCNTKIGRFGKPSSSIQRSKDTATGDHSNIFSENKHHKSRPKTRDAYPQHPMMNLEGNNIGTLNIINF